MGRLYNNGETCGIRQALHRDPTRSIDAFVDAVRGADEGHHHGRSHGRETASSGRCPARTSSTRVKSQVEGKRRERGHDLVRRRGPTRTGAYYPATGAGRSRPRDARLRRRDLRAGRVRHPRQGMTRMPMRLANDSRYGLGGGIFCKDRGPCPPAGARAVRHGDGPHQTPSGPPIRTCHSAGSRTPATGANTVASA